MKLSFADFGTGKPIVLIHAFPLTRQMWRKQTEVLSKNGFRVILPDLPGFGASVKNLPLRSMQEAARLIEKLLDSLNIEKAIIGGLSMGGYVSFNLFRTASEKFAALILCDTTHSADTDEKRRSRFELISKIEKSGAQALIEDMLPNLVSDKTKQNSSSLMSALKEDFSRVDPWAAIDALQSMAEREDCSDLLDKISVPTLLIFGEQDKVTNIENAQKMHRTISGSELSIIENAGHYSNLEQPEKFNQILLEFCRKIEF